MKTLTKTVHEFVAGRDRVICAEVAASLVPTLGYEPSPSHVSLSLASLAWDKTVIDGKVGYTRNERSHK